MTRQSSICTNRFVTGLLVIGGLCVFAANVSANPARPKELSPAVKIGADYDTVRSAFIESAYLPLPTPRIRARYCLEARPDCRYPELEECDSSATHTCRMLWSRGLGGIFITTTGEAKRVIQSIERMQ